MVILDATTLLLLIEPNAKPPLDPATRKPLERCADRLNYLRERLENAGTRIVIPTPVLAEVLVGAGTARSQYVNELSSTAAFWLAPFDVKAAVELSFLLEAGGKPAKKKLAREETWAKVKFDRQVVAIAKSSNIREIYTDDGHLSDVAEANGITVHHTWDLPLPPQKEQRDLFPEQDAEDAETPQQ